MAEIDRTSMMLGWLAGRRIAGARVGVEQIRTQIYLYNGVRLPALPEWDKETYPYALISYSEDFGLYSLSLSVGAWSVNENGQVVASVANRYGVSDDGSTWVAGGGVAGLHTPVWTNHDVYTDDTLYMATTIPLPVSIFVSGTWSYNGVELPALPADLDLQVYPYVTIDEYIVEGSSTLSHINITASTVPARWSGESCYIIENANTQQFSIDIGGSEWTVYEPSTTTTRRYYLIPEWTNYDLLSEDGTTQFASEPIKIYE